MSKSFVDRSELPYQPDGNPVQLFAFYSPHQDKPKSPDTEIAEFYPDLDPLLSRPSAKDEIELAKHYGFSGFVVEFEADHGREALAAARRIAEACDGAFSFSVSIQSSTKHTVHEGVSELFKHPRYKRLDGRPLVFVESAPSDSRMRSRQEYENENPYVVLAATSEFSGNPGNLGVDGVLQLAPHTVFSSFWLPRHVWRKRHSGAAEKAIYSYYRLVGVMTRRPFGHYADFEAVYTGWHSNTGPAAIAYAYNDPLYYERWLTSACARTAKNTNLPEPIVLLKSWNDWAHGATLLPDKKFGYRQLESTKKALVAAGPVISAGKRTYNLADFVVPGNELEGIPRKPIVVMQMGGVGSTAAINSLRALDLPDPVIHVHVLHDLDKRIEDAIRDLPDPSISLWEYVRSKSIRAWMKKADDKTVWNVVTILRDPVARDISGFINNIQEFVPDVEERLDRGDLDIGMLHDLYLSIPVRAKPRVYYEEFFEPVFPFHMPTLPYEHGKGYVIAENYPYRLIVFRYEDLGRVWSQGIQEFLGVAGCRLPEANKTEEKLVGKLYREFRKLPLPAEYVHKMYGDPVVQRFYSAEEIAASCHRYTNGLND